MDLYLGLDVGTSLVKACAFDAEGNPVAVARHRVAVQTPAPGWAEQDPEAVWRAAALCMRRVVEEHKDGTWKAVGVAGQGDGCWLVDGDLTPVGPAPLWLDGRAADLVSGWIDSGAARTYFDLTANVPFPGSVPALLAWYQRNAPTVLDRAAWLLSCADWIVARLTRTITTDPVNASRGVVDTRQEGWSRELAETLGLRDWSRLLPPTAAAVAHRGDVTGRASRATGLPAGVPVLAAMLDASAATIGAGVARSGQALTIMGTTAFSSVITSRPEREPPMVGFNAPTPIGLWARTMAAMAGTVNADLVATLLGIRGRDATARLATLAADEPSASRGMLLLPFVAPGGERAPFVEPTARGGLIGFDVSTTRATVARSALEGVALSIRHCHDYLPQSDSELVVTGGGARSRLWCQILADVMERSVVRVDVVEPGALGAALAAAVGSGAVPSVEDGIGEWVHMGDRFEPGPAAAAYQDLYGLYRRAIEAHLPLWRERATVTWPVGSN